MWVIYNRDFRLQHASAFKSLTNTFISAFFVYLCLYIVWHTLLAGKNLYGHPLPTWPINNSMLRCYDLELYFRQKLFGNPIGLR
jgi:hypothetical protein